MKKIQLILILIILIFDTIYAQDSKELSLVNSLSKIEKEFKKSRVEINDYLHKNNRDTNLFMFVPVYLTNLFWESDMVKPYFFSLTDTNHNSICEVIIILKKNYKPVGSRIYCKNRFSNYYFDDNRYSCLSTTVCGSSYVYINAIFHKNLKKLLRETHGDLIFFSVNNFYNLFYIEKNQNKMVKILKYKR